jgi:hypothetical protein
MLGTGTYTTSGWAFGHDYVDGADADDLQRIGDFRRSLDGRILGQVERPDVYEKMIWRVGYASRQTRGASSTGTLIVPSNVQDDDLLIFTHVNDGVTRSMGSLLPSGFAHVAGSPMTTCGDTLLTVAYKVASSEGSFVSYGAVTPTDTATSAMLTVYRNADPANPIGEVATACDTTTSGSIYVDSPLISPTDENEFFQLIIAGKNDADLGEAFTTNAYTNGPRMGFSYNYFAADPSFEASVIGVAGHRGPQQKITATSLWLHLPRTGVGTPFMSIQIRRRP